MTTNKYPISETRPKPINVTPYNLFRFEKTNKMTTRTPDYTNYKKWQCCKLGSSYMKKKKKMEANQSDDP